MQRNTHDATNLFGRFSLPSNIFPVSLTRPPSQWSSLHWQSCGHIGTSTSYHSFQRKPRRQGKQSNTISPALAERSSTGGLWWVLTYIFINNTSTDRFLKETCSPVKYPHLSTPPTPLISTLSPTRSSLAVTYSLFQLAFSLTPALAPISGTAAAVQPPHFQFPHTQRKKPSIWITNKPTLRIPYASVQQQLQQLP